MQIAMLIAMLAMIGCAHELRTTDQTRDVDCRQWAANAEAEEVRAKSLNGGKGTYTADVAAQRYRDAIARQCPSGAIAR